MPNINWGKFTKSTLEAGQGFAEKFGARASEAWEKAPAGAHTAWDSANKHLDEFAFRIASSKPGRKVAESAIGHPLTDLEGFEPHDQINNRAKLFLGSGIGLLGVGTIANSTHHRTIGGVSVTGGALLAATGATGLLGLRGLSVMANRALDESLSIAGMTAENMGEGPRL